jgi:hypothetical protein
MKTNLDKYFASDEKSETEGVWFELTDGVSFKVKRFGGSNSTKIKYLQQKYLKPYARQIDKGLMDDKKERQLYVKIFVEACMVDWKGVVDDNNDEVLYSQENALELFTNLPDLFDFLVASSTDDNSYREDLGNS